MKITQRLRGCRRACCLLVLVVSMIMFSARVDQMCRGRGGKTRNSDSRCPDERVSFRCGKVEIVCFFYLNDDLLNKLKRSRTNSSKFSLVNQQKGKESCHTFLE